jgi:hypothetical protein
MAKRKKPTQDVEAQVIFKSDRRCCVCQKLGDHIHHIDGNPANSVFDNLAFLCFKHHNKATIEKSLNKKLTSKTVIKYRDHWYKVVENKRKHELQTFNKPLTRLTEEDLLQASKNAIVIIEIAKVREEFFGNTWLERNKSLDKLYKFSNHTNYRVAYDVFLFLSEISELTRHKLPYEMSTSISMLIEAFLPAYDIKSKNKHIELAKLGCNTAFSLIYDGCIKRNNLGIAEWGYDILKFIYQQGKYHKITTIQKEVENQFEYLKLTLNRPDRDDLEPAKQLLDLFYRDLNRPGGRFPEMSHELWQIIETSQQN